MTKMRQWSLLTGLAVVVVLAAGWFLLVSPQRSHAAALRTQADSQRAANATLQTRVQQLQAQAKDLPHQQALLAQISQKIPDNPALPSLIRALSSAADHAGVDLVSLAPAKPAAVTASGAAAAPVAKGKSAPAPSLSQISVAIQVKGTYFNVEEFDHNLEELSRALKVTGLTLAAGGDGQGSGTQLTGTIQAVVFTAPASTSAPAVTPTAASQSTAASGK